MRLMAAKAYLCVGGPLDGMYVKSTDFAKAWRKWDHSKNSYSDEWEPEGQFHSFVDDYIRFNNGIRGNKHSMIWLHKTLLDR
jgi:hypothetical protein